MTTFDVVGAIREAYPCPGRSFSNKTGVYCVGGALMLSLGYPYQMPFPGDLAGGLKDMGCGDESMEWASLIIQANDDGDVELAWKVLGMALKAGEV